MDKPLNQRAQRRWVSRLALVLLVGAAASAVVAWQIGWFEQRPNILLITLDTTRPDHLGCYGSEIALTPALDQLAAQGVLFERAMSPAPLTLPVHASLMTGLYPPEHGLITNGAAKLGKVPNLASLLQENGYETGAFVSSFVLHSQFGLDRGFGTYDDDLSMAGGGESLHRQRDGQSVVDAALEWLKGGRRSPTFCWVHFYDPHAPYESHAGRFGDRFEGRPYDAEIAFMDEQVARLLEFVRSQGKRQTLVIVAGDHGEGLGDHIERTHGFTLYGSTQHVPLLISWPERFQPRSVSATVSLVDLLPTLADLLGLAPRGPVTGRSLRPALEGKPLEERPAFAMTADPYIQNRCSPLRSLTNDRYRYIQTTRPELYDLAADPGEKNNLLAGSVSAAHAQVSKEMDQAMSDLESRMLKLPTDTMTLSPAERAILKGLGYLGPDSEAIAEAKNLTASEDGSRGLPDVKDMLQFDVETEAALELMNSGRVTEAVTRLEALTRRAPSHADSRVFLGEAYEKLNEPAFALSAYESALDANPEHVNAHVHLANLCIEAGQLTQAQELLKKALEINPYSASALYNLGLVHRRLDDPDAARRNFEDVLLEDPLFQNAHAALGNLFAASGNAPAAMAEYEQELALYPRSVEAHIGLASSLAQRGQYQEALPHLRRVTEVAPRVAIGWFNLGVCLEALKSPDEAAEAFVRAVQLDDSSPAKAALKRLRP